MSNPLPLAHNTSENQPLDIDKWAEMLTVDTYTPPDPSVPLEFDYTGLKRSTTAETMACGFACMLFHLYVIDSVANVALSGSGGLPAQ